MIITSLSGLEVLPEEFESQFYPEADFRVAWMFGETLSFFTDIDFEFSNYVEFYIFLESRLFVSRDMWELAVRKC